MRDAAQLLREKTPGLTAWRCAGYLASLIHYFEIRVMPVLKMNPARPLSDVERAIYRILLTGHRGPRTQRKIFDLLN
jgi:hypothetical protein